MSISCVQAFIVAVCRKLSFCFLAISSWFKYDVTNWSITDVFSSSSSSSTPGGMVLIETAPLSVKASGIVAMSFVVLLFCMALFYESFHILGTQDPSRPTV